MAVYRTTMSSPALSHIGFFDTLGACLQVIRKEGLLNTVELATPVAPAENKDNPHWARSMAWSRDVMLLRDSVPLVKVFMRYDPSSGLKRDEEAGYAATPSYAGAASIDDMQASLAERLRASVPKPEPKAPAAPEFNEGRWTIVLRVPGSPTPEVFTGEPSDIDGIDKAFSRLVDILIARIPKPTNP